MYVLFAGVVAAVAATAPPSTVQLSFEEILARRVPGQEQLSLASELANARRAVSASGKFLAEGPTLAVAGGARRAEATQGDVVLDLDLPLLARRGTRAELESALVRAESLLPEAVRLEAEAVLFGLVLDAWAAQERTTLRQDDLELIERWLEIARARADAGAMPQFEIDLVESEVGRARTLLAQASWQRRLAWGDLRSRAEVPAEPVWLQLPPLAATRPPEQTRAQFAEGTLRSAPAVRAALSAALLRLQTAQDASRWSLRPSLAREGDEQVARLGLAWRMPRGGEIQALDSATDSEIARLDREARSALVLLETRFENAVMAQAELTRITEFDSRRALTALEARLREGKAQLFEVLSIRRQLLATREAEFERLASVARAARDIHYLTLDVQP